MKLKLTLGLPEGDTDVLLTVDVLASIGEISRNLVVGVPGSSPHREAARSNSAPLTLRVRYPNNPVPHILDPLASVFTSGLCSGCWVEVIQPSQARPTDVMLYQRSATATVLSGPQAGLEFGLTPGPNTVGRGRGCRVLLADDAVSRRHAVIEVGTGAGAGITITDQSSGNGVYVDDHLVAAAQLGPANVVAVGNTTFSVTPVQAPPAPSGAGRPLAVVEFARSPRVDERYPDRKLSAPVPPRRGEPQKFPFLAVIAPLVMGGVLFAVTHSPLSLVFVALSPIIMLGTYIDTLVTERRKKKETTAQFESGLEAVRGKLTIERGREAVVRNAESPSTMEVCTAMLSRSALLWTRRPEHQTFLEVRLGLGGQLSRIDVELPARNESEEKYWTVLEDFKEENTTVPGVPVLEKFDRAGSIGIAGSSLWSEGVLRSIIVQLCGLHSPSDLVLACFADPDSQDEWQWLKWLPHVGSVYSPIATSHLAADATTSGHLLAQLEEVLARRKAERSAAGGSIRSHLEETASIDELHGQAVRALPTTPVIVAIVMSDSQVDRGRLVTLAEEGPDYSVHLLWHAASVADLPAACRTYVDVAADGTGVVGFVRSATRVVVSPLEIIAGADAAVAARLLSPVQDSGARELDESDLPASVSYQDLQPENVISSPDAVAALWDRSHSLTARWRDNPPHEAGTLSGIVGQGASGVLRLDLREHGPHALVGGTTGSGKSEFLQTWIMSLASEYSPDRLTFLLIDYKGGAAFAECTRLPHTVGLVTDLNTHLVRRALTSLRAELHYRETLLNDKGAKDLISLEKRGDPDAPPSLVIVIDEFAALVGEVPEFVDGIVDVAQRGRSLGLHLVMATQRPAGVIKDNLRANTNLRIALRVADESDSQDVIGRKDAATFDPATPGRGVAKLGPGKLIHFQTGYLGGRSRAAAKLPDIDIAEFPFEVRDSWPVDLPSAPVRRDTPRDIELMLHSIQAAAAGLHLETPRKPWLSPLADVVDLRSVDTGPSGTGAADLGSSIALGIQDEPQRQRQSPFGFDPDAQGNLAILGTSGSGKSAALRTLAISASCGAKRFPVEIYAIDFAGGALGLLGALPTVGAVIPGDDTERVERLIRHLVDVAAERALRYAKEPASTLTDYRQLSGNTAEPRILVLIDGMANFRHAYEFRAGDGTFQALAQLLSVGRQVGIHFAVSADRAGVIPTVLSANIQLNIVLRMASQADYGILGVPADILEDAPPGRGVRDGGEVQFAVLGGSSSLSDQSLAAQALGDELRAAGVQAAAPIQRLAERIRLDDLRPLADNRPVIGVADSDLLPIGISPEGLVVVTGPLRSGKTTALKTLVRTFTRSLPGNDPILISPRPGSELAGFAPWSRLALGLSDSETLARDLIASLGSGTWPVTGSPGVIVVETAGDFEGSTAESAVATLIKAARKANVLIVVETDLSTGPAAWQIHSELKTARVGLVLQPEESDGIGLFRVAFPRGSRADFPEGRGYLVESGRATKVQVALTD
ncbi:FHA domain-containing protein [Cryobacterium algoricola]|uniref:FHA domain-containing protein n=1 Tax=Cryobacterium algoricola TaxID=1259183 RepID=A0ABY2I982_9MICO|nr:FtsK/SpoIIIE domain-containing protein [Cryobacterium algoricola]TFB83208.1 FHA domain-containing protein [Cryobacterium algoricola]